MTWLLTLLACGEAQGEKPHEPAPAVAPAPVAPAPVAAPAADPTAVIASGTITAATAPTAVAVFVSVKAEGKPGPPLAAKRLPPGPFPMDFVITEADRPMVNGPIPDTFVVKVTLDIDGDPMSKSDTDLEVMQTAQKGATGLALALAPRAAAP